MCSIFYPGEIFLENASCYRVIALHTRRSVDSSRCPTEHCRPTTGKTPRARTRAKVVISCSTFSNAVKLHAALHHRSTLKRVKCTSLPRRVRGRCNPRTARRNRTFHCSVFSEYLTFYCRNCNTTNSNSQRWVWYLLYWETYTGSIIVELPVPFWSRYRSVLIIVQSPFVSLLSVGWRSRSGYYIPPKILNRCDTKQVS